MEGVGRIADIQYIGIGRMEQFLADGGDPIVLGIPDGIIPFQEIPIHLPAVEVNGEFGREQGQLLADPSDVPSPFIQFELGQEGDDFFLHQAQLMALGIADLQAMPPGQLPFHHKDRTAVFVVDIITVEPGKDPLAE